MNKYLTDLIEIRDYKRLRKENNSLKDTLIRILTVSMASDEEVTDGEVLDYVIDICSNKLKELK